MKTAAEGSQNRQNQSREIISTETGDNFTSSDHFFHRRPPDQGKTQQRNSDFTRSVAAEPLSVNHNSEFYPGAEFFLFAARVEGDALNDVRHAPRPAFLLSEAYVTLCDCRYFYLAAIILERHKTPSSQFFETRQRFFQGRRNNRGFLMLFGLLSVKWGDGGSKFRFKISNGRWELSHKNRPEVSTPGL